MLASIKSTNINTQQINSTQNIKYKTDKLNKAKIINKTGKEIIKQMWRDLYYIRKGRFVENSFSLCELLARTFLTKHIHNRCKVYY